MKFRFLGTGTSVGVPQIGCRCRTCTSTDPRDRRRRTGVYVSVGDGGGMLLDAPPELRLACIEYGIDRVDAIVLTHAHMDHVAGFDDVRRFNTINGGVPMPCYAMAETIEQMHRVFPYISNQRNREGLFRPMIDFHAEERFTVDGLGFERLAVEHGFPCCGYLITTPVGSRLGYVSDCHVLPEPTLQRLSGVDILVLNCLRERFHPTHLNLEAALAYFDRIRPRCAYLVHMCHDLTHAELAAKLPAGVEPAYDGLELELP